MKNPFDFDQPPPRINRSRRISEDDYERPRPARSLFDARIPAIWLLVIIPAFCVATFVFSKMPGRGTTSHQSEQVSQPSSVYVFDGDPGATAIRDHQNREAAYRNSPMRGRW